MTAQHTPGPWHVHEKSPVNVMGSDDFLVAKTSADGRSYRERLDNADLIAAAPRLLKALTDLADEFASPNPLSDLRKARIAEARDAIAEARGEK